MKAGCDCDCLDRLRLVLTIAPGWQVAGIFWTCDNCPASNKLDVCSRGVVVTDPHGLAQHKQNTALAQHWSPLRTSGAGTAWSPRPSWSTRDLRGRLRVWPIQCAGCQSERSVWCQVPRCGDKGPPLVCITAPPVGAPGLITDKMLRQIR